MRVTSLCWIWIPQDIGVSAVSPVRDVALEQHPRWDTPQTPDVLAFKFLQLFKLKLKTIFKFRSLSPSHVFVSSPSTVHHVTSALSLANQTSKLHCQYKHYSLPRQPQILPPVQVHQGKQRIKDIIIIIAPQERLLHTNPIL